MNISMLSLILVLILILVTQVIALFVQYRVNKSYPGIGYWLLGSSLMALGYIFMSLVSKKSFEILARIANPLVILGYILFYIGIKKFLNKKINKWIPISIFVVFNLFYYYYMFINNNTSARTLIIAIATAGISFIIAYQLYSKKYKSITVSANYIAAVFFVYGCFYITRGFQTIMLPPVDSYLEQSSMLITSFILSAVTSNLWTFGLITMINQRLNHENALEKEKFQSIFDTNMDAQLITRLDDGFIIDVNAGFTELSGYSKNEVIGTSIQAFNFWKNPKEEEFFITELNDKGVCKNLEFTFQRKDKSQFTGTISAVINRVQNERNIISTVRDITERKEFEKAIIESEEKYRSILNASPDDITITDLEGHIIMISPAAKEMFGYALDYDGFLGMRLTEFIVPEDVERAKRNLQEMYKGDDLSPNEYRGVRQDKSIFDIEVNSGFVFDTDGLPSKMVFIIRDITERKQNERKIEKLLQQIKIERNKAQYDSITDSLTGLANRRYFDESFEREFYRLRRTGAELSLIMLDIDYFKKFNDSYGHIAGDQCLRMIATTLKTIIVRGADVIARYGGEEFIAILPGTDEKGAKILGEGIRRAIEGLSIPHSDSDISEYVTVSAGIITIIPTDFESPEKALKMVDEALYRAKESGRNICVYSTVLT